MIQLERLMNPQAARTLYSAGLHKVAAALEKVASGRDIPEINIEAALRLIGEKSFVKRAERRRILAGLAALEKLYEG